MISTLPIGTLGSVASFLAATLYQGNPDRNHKLWNIVSTERYIRYMQVLLECFVLCVCFVDRCLSFCIFFFVPLRCLFFFDIRILITPLASLNSS
jgi:hypothetical protein